MPPVLKNRCSMMMSPRIWGVVLAACAMAPMATGAGWFGGAAQTSKIREAEIYEEAAEHFTAFFLAAESWTIPGLSVAVPLLDFVLTLDTCTSYRRHQGSKRHPWLQVRPTHQQDALASEYSSDPGLAQVLFSCMVGTFGGTTINAIILGETAGWLHAAGSPIAFGLGFWCIFCCPGFLARPLPNASAPPRAQVQRTRPCSCPRASPKSQS